MTPAIKPRPTFRNGNLDFYRCRDAAAINWGPAGTGKTLTALYKLVMLGMMFPKTRSFIVRKTRASLTESALVTLERDVFGEESPILLSRPMLRKTRDYYELQNGSVIVCAGMDRPERLFSTEYNWGYIQEATELEQDEWQSLKRSLRAPFKSAMVGKLGKPYRPFRQLLGDCNPSYEHHWINRDIQEGRITGFQSRHEDNPRYHNGHGWTKEGDEYLTQQLGTLTGFMRARLLIGQWAMAEGLVYDTFDEKIHVLPASFTIPESWPRYWSIDWGWTDPLVLQFWAKDGDGRLYLYREYYMTEKLVEDVAKWAKNEIEMKREPRPKAIVCDHDPENAATFMRHSGLSCTLADKLDKKGGIQKVKERLIVRGDGRPRLFIIQGALTHPIDSKLRGKGKPTRLTDELRSYAWEPKRDEPQDGNDHGCDAMLYVVRHVDAGGGWGIK